jgi:Icc-related predicted phosphoesterase
VPDEFEGDPLSPAFSSDLSELILKYQPALWVHGHTHGSIDCTIGETRVLCNPKGYGPMYGGRKPENKDFIDDLV